MNTDHDPKHTDNRKNNRGSIRNDIRNDFKNGVKNADIRNNIKNDTRNDIRNNNKNGINNNIRNKCVGKSIRNNIRDHSDLYMTCCIPIIPFNLSAHMLLYLSSNYEGWIGGFGNVLLLLSGILLFVCLAVFRYSLKSYIRQKSEQYSILLMLGISGWDFWRNLAAEYCPPFFPVDSRHGSDKQCGRGSVDVYGIPQNECRYAVSFREDHSHADPAVRGRNDRNAAASGSALVEERSCELSGKSKSWEGSSAPVPDRLWNEAFAGGFLSVFFLLAAA